MHENANEGLKGGTNTTLTVVLIIVVIALFTVGIGLYKMATKKADVQQTAVQTYQYSDYDNATVAGQSVIAAIKTYANSSFTVKVITSADSTGKSYTAANGYNISDITDPDYIEPSAQFTSVLVNNSNKTPVGITFTQK